jgi:hypothetical protein
MAASSREPCGCSASSAVTSAVSVVLPCAISPWEGKPDLSISFS